MFDASLLQSFVNYTFLGLNWVDVLVIIVFVFYAIEGFQLGIILALLDFVSFVVSFLIGLSFYNAVAQVLSKLFPLPIGFANALGFFLIALLMEVIINILFRTLVYHRLPLNWISPHRSVMKRINQWLGVIPGIISACIIVAFVLTLIVSVPVSPFLKTLVANSQIGSRFIAYTGAFEGRLNAIFGGALHDTISYLTVEPQSNESIDLHFTVTNGPVDSTAEDKMLVMVNHERTSRGESALDVDPQLTQLAEHYGSYMFSHGYFSHYTPQGLSPFDRMQQAGIAYTAAGENLALAPTVDLAMQGLMNSPGHKANILSTSFHHVGIGVIDGGIYGEMFVQEFTN